MGAFQEGRAELTQQLQTAFGRGWEVIDQPRRLDVVSKPTIALERTRVERAPFAPQGSNLDTYSLFLISPRTDDEDHLDELLETALEALDSIKAPWKSAARGVYKNNPAYEITLPLPAKRKAKTNG